MCEGAEPGRPHILLLKEINITIYGYNIYITLWWYMILDFSAFMAEYIMTVLLEV